MVAARPLLIVVPCYNEAARLAPDQFVAFANAEPGIGFVCVDDGSTDSTRRVLHDLATAAAGGVHVVELDRNGGKAEAVRRGLQHACSLNATMVGYWDADLATPLDAIVRFREALAARPGLHVVLGARVKLLGRAIDRTPSRHVVGRVFATLASMAIDLPVYDTQCGAKLLRNSEVLRDALATPFRSRWAFDVELLLRLKRGFAAQQTGLEAVCCELPLDSWRDVHGSKLKAADLPRSLAELGRIWWEGRR
ncbi:MAG: glycosyltransferase [Myxococcales bacterium]|nr:glycosyltransferase [Myxococcales bacterium]